MKTKIKKPSFKETVAITTMDLDNAKFNAQRIGPMDFLDLRKADYGKNFRMPTIGELIPLVYDSLENKNYETAKNVIQTLEAEHLIGNTGILYTKKGMFVQDNPNIRSGKISMSQKALEKKLGSHEEKGVVFSDDKSIRFTPYGFKEGEQTSSQLSVNPGIIAIVNGQENAEMLGSSAEHYELPLCFRSLENFNSSKVRGLEFYLYHYSYRNLRELYLVSEYPIEEIYGSSFGMLGKDAKGVKLKKQTITNKKNWKRLENQI